MAISSGRRMAALASKMGWSGSGTLIGARSSAKADAGSRSTCPPPARAICSMRRVSAVTWRNSAAYDTGRPASAVPTATPSRCSSTRTMYVPGPLSGNVPE